MTARSPTERCRLVLIAPPVLDAAELAARAVDAVSGGDVASFILPGYGEDEAGFQRRAERLAPPLQERGVAVIIAGDTRIAGRVGADGVHLETGKAALAEAVERLQRRMIVGAGGARTRDEALELGEVGPDYLFFGRFGYDRTPEPHPRNMALGAWWAEMIEIPCIVLGGSDVASVVPVAGTGAEFVALESAVFAHGDAAAQVARANELLDSRAPSLEA
jgi:thiamine-phosphate pyrophosphorylase